MGAEPVYTVRIVEWNLAHESLMAVRTTVFVEEQSVPVTLERDGRDPDCVHVFAQAPDGQAIGAGRLLPDGRIGRMAVLKSWRGSGVGGAMLQALMAEAKRRGHAETHLHSQAHARAFYERHGYVVEGGEYLEAGIPHIEMRAKL